METKIDKTEFDAVMRALNTSIEQFEDADFTQMDEIVTVWASGETTAPAFTQYLHRMLGARNLMSHYYYELLKSNYTAIENIAASYMELDRSSSSQVEETISANNIFGY